MAYTLPASHLKDLVEGLAKAHERGIKYPIPTFLRYQPEVRLAIPLTDIFHKVSEKNKKINGRRKKIIIDSDLRR
jgi:hypothetical protein